ncbi:MAG: helix-turn-helix domain-containing protein [Planctomycetes bacterium]|nr:helix-turn-helix domain-containing protein [Planctomycetota bacterium]MBU1518080.1 helix-turn-helix domain-containing protein [Planctomycetota bacterium]MBU2458519.1 helix-turn-helix domain-containing protein [Planctomycetota bacterium]
MNNNNKRKDIFTTGQVAQICKVAPRTVTKWFDTGQLKGYRIPGGRDRRIPAAELLRFMKTNNMPTDQIEHDKIRILIIDSDWQLANSLAEVLRKNPSFGVETANSSFDAGLIAQKFEPHVILINLKAADIDADLICGNIRKTPELTVTKVVALAEGLKPNETGAILNKGYDYCLTDTSDIAEIGRTINRATSII